MPGATEVIGDIIDAVEGVVDAIIDAIGDVLEFLWKDVLMPIFEFVVGLFGIEDEDVISTEVITHRMIEDNLDAGDLMVKITLEEQAAPVGIIDRLMAYSQVTRNRYSRYFEYGDVKFVDGLPDCNLRAIVVDDAAIKAIIDSEESIDCTISSSELGGLNKDIWVGYTLQEQYGYTAYDNVLPYNGYLYRVANIDYNYTTDVYDVYIVADEDVTTTITTTTTVVVTPLHENTAITTTTNTTITITNIDATYDNKNTTVTENVVVVGDVSGLLSDDTVEISNVDEQIPKDTESGSSDDVVVDTAGTNYYADSAHTVVDENTLVEGTQQGLVSDTDVEISNVTLVVGIGTVEDSVTEEISDTTEIGVEFATDTLQVAAYPLTRFYIVKYFTTDAGEWSIWLYEEGLGTYPSLDASNAYVTDLDMMPIVTLRNSTISVNSDKESDRYKQSKDMLEYLSLDIDDILDAIEENPDITSVEDSFIHFGLQPSDTSAVVSKSLFKMFNYIYDDSGLKQDNDKYTVTIKEGSFNAAVGWSAQSKVVNSGILGPRGFYSHEVVGKNLVMNYQAAEEEYVTLTITNLSSITFIDRQGLYGTVTKDVDRDEFFIPVCYFFITDLSPLEQYSLFNRTLMMSHYAANVQHLEWYETEAFGDFLSIIAIILTVVSFGSMAWTNGIAAALKVMALYVAISLGATFLLQLIMESTDSDAIRILAGVVYAVGMAYMGMADFSSLSSLELVTVFATTLGGMGTAMMMHIDIEMGDLALEAGAYDKRVKELEAEHDKAKEALDVGIDTEYVAFLKSLELPNPYLESVDAMMYKAVEGQYDFGKMYNFDGPGDFYSNKLRLGVV